MGRGLAALTAFAGTSTIVACSVLTDLSGFAERPPEPLDASVDAPAIVDASVEAQPAGDATTGTDGSLLVEGGTTYAATVLADAPLMYLRLGEKGGVSASDATMKGNTGALGNGHTFGVPGAIAADPDTALRLDGTASGMNLGRRFDFGGTQPYTLEIWAKIDLVDQVFRHLFKKTVNLSSNRHAYGIYAFNDELVYERFVAGQKLFVAIDVFPLLNRWLHIVATYGSTTMRMYIDGVEIGSRADARPQPAIDADFWIGCDEALNSGVWKGDVDEIAVYDKALPAERVKAHFDVGKGTR